MGINVLDRTQKNNLSVDLPLPVDAVFIHFYRSFDLKNRKGHILFTLFTQNGINRVGRNKIKCP
jgi:hypothetical protein